ncbi:MAG: sensor histidine kinase, partial [Gemmatimonadota bacterium]
ALVARARLSYLRKHQPAGDRMRLSKFITENEEEILQEFEDFARTRTEPGRDMDITELRDDARGILKVIALDLEAPQSEHAKERKAKGDAPPSGGTTEDTPAEKHGTERAMSDFSLEETVSEYRALRASVLRLWTASGGIEADPATLEDITRFDEAIDQALAESINRYSLEIDRLREEQATEGLRIEKEVTRARAAFLQIVSHEMRTPLNAIAGYTHILLEGIRAPVSQPQVEVLRRMNLARQHLSGIVEGILEFQRTGTESAFDLVEVPVEEAIAGLGAIVGPTARDDGLEFTVDVQADGARIRVDRQKLRQVLINLISNAVRSTPEGGRVWLDYVETPEHACLRVHDTGMGIPKEQVEAIFEPFVQIENELNDVRGGVGLGLAISRHLTDGMGGTLTVESELGKGSVFTVALPKIVQG